MARGIEGLRARAISHTFFRPVSLKAAIDRLGFVQADPIRSPARAQDLILRHRVARYSAGDLERQYAALDIEEDVLYAYGFLSRDVWQLLHPRGATRTSALDRKILDAVRASGALHPRHLEASFGRARVVNAWGGYSKATKHALERLHRRGLLRIARRERGIRVYEAAPPLRTPWSPDERLRRLILAMANVLAPIREKALHSLAARARRSIPQSSDHRTIIRAMLQTATLESDRADGIAYVWPAPRRRLREPPRVVRFLAPFDPLVWERQRFEHFWGWQYRFEAYTPPAQRVRGYYALPLLWIDRIVGWANARAVGSTLEVAVGFSGTRPAEDDFAREVDAEAARLQIFLGLETARVTMEPQSPCPGD